MNKIYLSFLVSLILANASVAGNQMYFEQRKVYSYQNFNPTRIDIRLDLIESDHEVKNDLVMIHRTSKNIIEIKYVTASNYKAGMAHLFGYSSVTQKGSQMLWEIQSSKSGNPKAPVIYSESGFNSSHTLGTINPKSVALNGIVVRIPKNSEAKVYLNNVEVTDECGDKGLYCDDENDTVTSKNKKL